MAGLGARARKRGKQFHQAYEQIDFAHARTVDRKIWARASGKSRRGVEHQGTERVGHGSSRDVGAKRLVPCGTGMQIL